MNALLALSRAIDALNERVGRLVYWLVLVAVLISCANAIVRKAFDMSSNAFLEIQWYLFSADLPALRGLHAAQEPAHPHRRDRRPAVAARTQTWIDVFGTAVLPVPDVDPDHVPLVAGVRAWPTSGEVSTNAGGLILWPARLLVPIGFVLLICRASPSSSSASRSCAGTDPRPDGEAAREDGGRGARRGDPARAGRARMSARQRARRPGRGGWHDRVPDRTTWRR